MQYETSFYFGRGIAISAETHYPNQILQMTDWYCPSGSWAVSVWLCNVWSGPRIVLISPLNPFNTITRIEQLTYRQAW